jgi:hypothetical protein
LILISDTKSCFHINSIKRLSWACQTAFSLEMDEKCKIFNLLWLKHPLSAQTTTNAWRLLLPSFISKMESSYSERTNSRMRSGWTWKDSLKIVSIEVKYWFKSYKRVFSLRFATETTESSWLFWTCFCDFWLIWELFSILADLGSLLRGVFCS